MNKYKLPKTFMSHKDQMQNGLLTLKTYRKNRPHSFCQTRYAERCD